MKQGKNINDQNKSNPKPILNEDSGKRTPPAPTGYITGGKSRANRPEQGPDVPPQERTEGIP